jgi:hypothetical protein
MTSKKKAAGLDALAHAGQGIEKPLIIEQSTSPTAKKTKSFPLHLPLPVHSALREIAFHENTSMTKIILEGVDEVLKNRGLKSISEMQIT